MAVLFCLGCEFFVEIRVLEFFVTLSLAFLYFFVFRVFRAVAARAIILIVLMIFFLLFWGRWRATWVWYGISLTISRFARFATILTRCSCVIRLLFSSFGLRRLIFGGTLIISTFLSRISMESWICASLVVARRTSSLIILFIISVIFFNNVSVVHFMCNQKSQRFSMQLLKVSSSDEFEKLNQAIVSSVL